MILAVVLSLCVSLGTTVPGPQDSSSPQSQTSSAPAQGTSAPAPSAPPKKTPARKPKPSTAKSSTSHASQAKKPPSPDDPPKKVVHQGSTSQPTVQLAPAMTDEESAKLRASTATLRKSAQDNLDAAAVNGTQDKQKETAAQVRTFLDQSSQAEKEGDLQRAAALANKAKLLSDSLVTR